MAVNHYKINYKSDFVLTINGDAGWAVPFCIKFWTGAPSQAYFVGYDGKTYTNCRQGDDATKLVVLFDDHHLPIGDLKMQIAYHTTIEEFPTVEYDEVTNPADVITEIDGEEYRVMLDFTGETAPEIQFALPAYYNEQERQRVFAEMQAENAQAVQEAENVNAQLNGTILTVTNRNGESTSQDVQGPPGRSEQADWSQNDSSQPDYIKNKPDIYTQQQTDQLLAGKQNVITDLATIRSNAEDGKQALTDVTAVEQLIPSTASAQNKLTDQNFVNNSISTNTANFVGTYNSLAELQAVQNPTNNDYGFVIEQDAAGNEYYDRYKYVASSQQWLFEYKVESTPFTAAQWAAIQSGITSALVTKLTDLPTNAELQQALTLINNTLAGKANSADLAPVATSGNYNDLTNKPTIPTALSQLSEDATHRVVTDAEKTNWNGKQDALVSGTNIKTINNESILGSGNINVAAELPSNTAYLSNDSGDGIVPDDGVRAVTVTSAAAISVSPDVVTAIDGAVGTAAITFQVPQDNLAHVWDIFMTTDSAVNITFAMSASGATIKPPKGFTSVAASTDMEIRVVGKGTKYYLSYGEFA